MSRKSLRMGRDLEAENMLHGLARRLKTARQMIGARLEDIARASNCSESIISRVESGKSFLSLPMLTRLAATLGVEVSWLLEGDPDDVPSIKHFRLRSRIPPKCSIVSLNGIHSLFGPTSSLVENVRIMGDEVFSRISPPDKPAACLVLEGALDISSRTSFARAKAGEFFEISGVENFTYRSASESGVSMMVISL